MTSPQGRDRITAETPMAEDCVLEEWVVQGQPHRLRFTGEDIVVEHKNYYRDIGAIWEGCYFGQYILPNINEQPEDQTHEGGNG